MKLPLFNPREVPSIALSSLAVGAVLPAHAVSVGFIKAAVARQGQSHAKLSSPWINTSLLRSDVSSVEPYRTAAVLVLLIENGDDIDVVLTVRASHLRHHAGQISFVGGALELGETALQAALREAMEEVGFDNAGLHVLGELPIYHTITGFAITPIVASMTAVQWREQNIVIDEQEVDHMFTVPLSVLLNHSVIQVHDYTWENQTRQYYSVTHEGYFIWGASMAILRNLDMLLHACIGIDE